MGTTASIQNKTQYLTYSEFIISKAFTDIKLFSTLQKNGGDVQPRQSTPLVG